MQWKVKNSLKGRSQKERREEILKSLYLSRDLKTKSQIDKFLNPPKPQELTPIQTGINSKQIKKAVTRIKKAKKNNEFVIVFGDYDADGICATAILWETLHKLGLNAMPFIPHREKHGYGLSEKGIKDIITQTIPSLIITVDNGIVAHQAVDYASQQGIDVIITDHHQKQKKLPQALAIIHTTQLSGSGVAWIFANQLRNSLKLSNLKLQPSSLDLATIGTVADMVSLRRANRSIVKHGLNTLQSTKRPGLKKLLHQAGIKEQEIGIYHINFIVAPRLNAMGRLEHALDSLRLLCTKDQTRASKLAKIVGSINKKRQEMTEEMLVMAQELYLSKKKAQDKIIIIEHNKFHEGIIGLIAGKMVEDFYRPTIVLARTGKFSKASARSITGFNIIENLRKTDSFLLDVGGHPMAAGFTIESTKIAAWKNAFRKLAKNEISQATLQPVLNINCEISLRDLSWKLFKQIEKLKPFGIGNPRPTFTINDVKPKEIRTVGTEAQHLKIFLPSFIKSQSNISAIWFNKGNLASKLPAIISLAFTIDENIFKDKRELQLKVKDIKLDSAN